MRTYLLLFIVGFLSFKSFAYDFDLQKMRTCKVKEETQAKELYHPSPIKKDYYARTNRDDGKLSFQDILEDKMIFFAKDLNGEMSSEYIWRYTGSSKKVIDANDHSIYSAGSVGASLLIIFKKEKEHVDVSYLNIKGNKVLVSLYCSL